MFPESAPTIFQSRAKGKLLLTGEYVVLDGAEALAIPVRYGQSVRVAPLETPERLYWESLDPDGKCWFFAEYSLPDLKLLHSPVGSIAETLRQILLACRQQNPAFLTAGSWAVQTQNDFPRRWGLGTSSTLIAALSRWAGVNPYRVLSDTLGGSGYDLACAYAEGPILYRLDEQVPHIQSVNYSPKFSDNLYFVYLEEKQNSREGIARYRLRAGKSPDVCDPITRLTQSFLTADTLSALDSIILEHEQLISERLAMQRTKDKIFPDFWGEVKSLGAWGGDFALATSAASEPETRAYFEGKGMREVICWRDML